MNTVPAIPKLADDVPKTVKDAFEALESWLRSVKADGGFVTAQKMVDSGYPLADDPAYHSSTGTAVVPGLQTGITGIDVVEELYATLKPGVYLSRLLVRWLGTSAPLYQVELVQNGLVVQSKDTQYSYCQFDGVDAGDYVVRVRQAEVKIVSSTGEWSSVATVVQGELALPEPPSRLDVFVAQSTATVRLVWMPSVDIDVVGYKIAYGAAYTDANVIITTGKQTEYEWTPNTQISSPFWIKAIDSGGRESAFARSSQNLAISPPVFERSGVSVQVIDNTVLLRWQPAAQGTYPIDHYEVRRSDPPTVAFDDAEIIGRVGGTFSAVYEQQAGSRVYWVYAVDTAGLASQAYSVYATVNANDYFILYSERSSLFDGTLTNAMLGNSGHLAAPVDLTGTYSDEFGSDTWAEQQTAGLVWYAQPGETTGSYSEEFAYVEDTAEALSYKIVLDVTRQSSGTVTVTPNIQVKALVGDAWTDLGDVYEVQPDTAYRHVKYTLSFASSDGGVCEVTNMSMRLLTKKITRSGRVSVDASGTAIVYITNDGTSTGSSIFAAVTSILLSPKGVGGAQMTAVWDIGIESNPTHFHVYLYNAAGTESAGTVDWTVTGV